MLGHATEGILPCRVLVLPRCQLGPPQPRAARRRFNWEHILAWSLIQVGVVLAPFTFTWTGLVVAAVLYLAAGLGVTMGYHRLLTHRSFQTPRFIEYLCSQSWDRWPTRVGRFSASPFTAFITSTAMPKATPTARPRRPVVGAYALVDAARSRRRRPGALPAPRARSDSGPGSTPHRRNTTSAYRSPSRHSCTARANCAAAWASRGSFGECSSAPPCCTTPPGWSIVRRTRGAIRLIRRATGPRTCGGSRWCRSARAGTTTTMRSRGRPGTGCGGGRWTRPIGSSRH